MPHGDTSLGIAPSNEKLPGDKGPFPLPPFSPLSARLPVRFFLLSRPPTSNLFCHFPPPPTACPRPLFPVFGDSRRFRRAHARCCAPFRFLLVRQVGHYFLRSCSSFLTSVSQRDTGRLCKLARPFGHGRCALPFCAGTCAAAFTCYPFFPGYPRPSETSSVNLVPPSSLFLSTERITLHFGIAPDADTHPFFLQSRRGPFSMIAGRAPTRRFANRSFFIQARPQRGLSSPPGVSLEFLSFHHTLFFLALIDQTA